jgi:hypothetical protein
MKVITRKNSGNNAEAISLVPIAPSDQVTAEKYGGIMINGAVRDAVDHSYPLYQTNDLQEFFSYAENYVKARKNLTGGNYTTLNGYPAFTNISEGISGLMFVYHKPTVIMIEYHLDLPQPDHVNDILRTLKFTE